MEQHILVADLNVIPSAGEGEGEDEGKGEDEGEGEGEGEELFLQVEQHILVAVSLDVIPSASREPTLS